MLHFQVGLGAACAIVKSHLGRIYHHLQKMRAFLYLQIVLELAKILNVDKTIIESTYIRINGIVWSIIVLFYMSICTGNHISILRSFNLTFYFSTVDGAHF